MILAVSEVQFELLEVDSRSYTEPSAMCTGVLSRSDGHLVGLAKVISAPNPIYFPIAECLLQDLSD